MEQSKVIMDNSCVKCGNPLFHTLKMKICIPCDEKLKEEARQQVIKDFCYYPTRWEDSENNPDNKIIETQMDLFMALFPMEVAMVVKHT